MAVKSELIKYWKADLSTLDIIETISAKQRISSEMTLDDIYNSGVHELTVTKAVLLKVNNDRLEEEYSVLQLTCMTNDKYTDDVINTSSMSFIEAFFDMVEVLEDNATQLSSITVDVVAHKSKNFAGVFYTPVLKALNHEINSATDGEVVDGN